MYFSCISQSRLQAYGSWSRHEGAKDSRHQREGAKDKNYPNGKDSLEESCSSRSHLRGWSRHEGEVSRALSLSKFRDEISSRGNIIIYTSNM